MNVFKHISALERAIEEARQLGINTSIYKMNVRDMEAEMLNTTDAITPHEIVTACEKMTKELNKQIQSILLDICT